jgi:hypothetical protein
MANNNDYFDPEYVPKLGTDLPQDGTAPCPPVSVPQVEEFKPESERYGQGKPRRITINAIIKRG